MIFLSKWAGFACENESWPTLPPLLVSSHCCRCSLCTTGHLEFQTFLESVLESNYFSVSFIWTLQNLEQILLNLFEAQLVTHRFPTFPCICHQVLQVVSDTHDEARLERSPMKSRKQHVLGTTVICACSAMLYGSSVWVISCCIMLITMYVWLFDMIQPYRIVTWLRFVSSFSKHQAARMIPMEIAYSSLLQPLGLCEEGWATNATTSGPPTAAGSKPRPPWSFTQKLWQDLEGLDKDYKHHVIIASQAMSWCCSGLRMQMGSTECAPISKSIVSRIKDNYHLCMHSLCMHSQYTSIYLLCTLWMSREKDGLIYRSNDR